jgi:hypothetical protein
MEDMKIENPIRKSIALPRGGQLDVDLTPDFLKVVATHFELASQEQITDDHIRMYIWGAFKNALDRAEKGEGHVEETVS